MLALMERTSSSACWSLESWPSAFVVIALFYLLAAYLFSSPCLFSYPFLLSVFLHVHMHCRTYLNRLAPWLRLLPLVPCMQQIWPALLFLGLVCV